MKKSSLDIVFEYVCKEEANGKRWVCRNDIHKNLGIHINYAVDKLVETGILVKEYFNGRSVRYKLV